jgi:hypothetical protein
LFVDVFHRRGPQILGGVFFDATRRDCRKFRLEMTKLAIVTHRTGLRPDVVFHGTPDEAVRFYKDFSTPGEVCLFVCRSAERTKKLKAAEPDAEATAPRARKRVL